MFIIPRFLLSILNIILSSYAANLFYQYLFARKNFFIVCKTRKIPEELNANLTEFHLVSSGIHQVLHMVMIRT